MLIVEDNIDAGDSLSLLLRLDGHEVLVARSGTSALEVAPAFQPKWCFSTSGCRAWMAIKSPRLRQRPEFKTMLLCGLTGYSPSEADRHRPQQAGFDHHFVKPLNLKKLSELLAEACSKLGPGDQVRSGGIKESQEKFCRA